MWVRAALACAAVLAGARAWPGGAVCAQRAAGAGGARYVAFLSPGPGPGPGPAALVESAWAGRGRLRACWARRDPRLARAFRAACARRPPPAPGAALRRDLAALWRRRAACADPAPPGGSRRRRGWTLPGTLWCGAGDSAGNASELGLFRGPDRCCREHDRCSAQIAALQFNYGIRNYRLHTVSHCDCDARFRQCLLALNDTISNIIGVTFFNLLEVPCFVLEESEECVQWHWWGGCERYGVVPLARMVQQSQYHYSLPAEETHSAAVQPSGKGRKPSRAGRKRLRQGLGRNPGLHQAQRPPTAQWSRSPGTLSPASARDKAEPTTRHPAAQWGLEPGPPTAMTVLEQDLAGGRRLPGGAQEGAGGSAHPACTQDGTIGSSPAAERCGATPVPAVEGRRQQGLGRVCRCYKRLDKCEHQIAPQEVKYQLHNVDTRMLFHCNCTRRLARFLRRARDLGDVEVAVLADRIAMDCFVLEPPADCSLGEGSQHNSCITATRAVLVPARHLKKTLRRWGPPHVTSKAEHPYWKTQDSGGTLYEQCLQLALEQKLGARHRAVP
ncbi:group 3 secretory phospholipase A2 [Aquila chrysaetos chrysaetos]|uniref:group 3 secretory phospholipase A2 n=1 Tax=Aquila chrysaetos chrysaetos TaxID=223781 RepID=UPI0011772E12|nr:group 3 secretory phospholipase A2 [Aquila chrysaetos chrysaetos]